MRQHAAAGFGPAPTATDDWGGGRGGSGGWQVASAGSKASTIQNPGLKEIAGLSPTAERVMRYKVALILGVQYRSAQ